jgi:plasmid stabilization system protein ParE
MARKIIWTFESAADLEAIATYIARDSGFYARSFVREIRDTSLSLKEFSERGRMVPEFSNAAVRELFIKEYRIVVPGIIHGKRDLKALSEKGEWKN